MAVHMIVGFTVGTEKIIQALQQRGVANIVVLDEDHEGPPLDIDGITYYSTKDAKQFYREYPGMTFHFYRNRNMMADISNFEF